jgi:hypothetical protein
VTDERLDLLGQRASLLARMRNLAREAPGSEPARRVQLTVAMDRFLARLLATTAWGSWILKGGYANQLRAPSKARFTQDVDLRIDAPLDQARAILATAASTDLADLFSYQVGAPKPLVGPPGGGLRFPVLVNLAGSLFVSFGADLNSQDAIVGELERHPSDPLVGLLGFAISDFPVYPIAQQFAEKLHAFTRPREQENTRVKDLVDMVWFSEQYSFSSTALIDAGLATFGRRGEHPWPPPIPDAPGSWARSYAELRRELGIMPATAHDARDALAVFLEPVLAGQRGRTSRAGDGWSERRVEEDESPAAPR